VVLLHIGFLESQQDFRPLDSSAYLEWVSAILKKDASKVRMSSLLTPMYTWVMLFFGNAPDESGPLRGWWDAEERVASVAYAKLQQMCVIQKYHVIEVLSLCPYTTAVAERADWDVQAQVHLLQRPAARERLGGELFSVESDDRIPSSVETTSVSSCPELLPPELRSSFPARKLD
jgi:hypothetical protein